MSDILINPCQACSSKYGKDINNMRNCCYETCAGFLGVENVNNILYTECGKECERCMDKVKLANGKDLCEFRLSPPPLFYEVPHYFAPELRRTKNMAKAYTNCFALCNKLPNLSKQCKETCRLDASAVIDPKYIMKENFEDQSVDKHGSLPKREDRECSTCGSGIVFWIAFILMAIVLSYVIVIVLKGIFTNFPSKRSSRSIK